MLELKGFPEPVEAFSVSWAPVAEEGDAPGGWQLPAVMRWVARVGFVGRGYGRAGRFLSRASRGWGRADWRRTGRTVHTAWGSRCAGVRATRMSGCRM